MRELHATSSELQWIVDSYAMVFAGLLLVGGSLADRFGRKRFFLIGLTVFAAGSIGAAFSGSVHLLIAWRAVMGAGAALTIPASLSIVNDLFRDPGERARAIGAWAGTIGLGIAIGPIAGGLLLARFWWGSIFLVNVPIAVAALVGALVLVPDSKNPAAERPDPGGRAVVDRRPGPAAVGDHRGPDRGLGLRGGRRRRAGQPGRSRRLCRLGGPQPPPDAEAGVLLRSPLLRRRWRPSASASSGSWAPCSCQTQFLQFDLGLLPLQAGLRILPVAAMLVVSAPLSPVLARAASAAKFTVAAGLAAIAGGLWQVSAAPRLATTYGTSVPGLLLIGLGAGLLLPTATNSVVGSVPQGDSGVGSATNAVALQVGGALGVAVIGSVMSTRYQDHMTAVLAGRHVPSGVSHLILGSFGGALAVAARAKGARGALFTRAAREAFMSGLEISFLVAAVASVRRRRHCARLATFACAAKRTQRTSYQGRSFGNRQRRTTSPGVRGNVPAGLGLPSCLSSTKSSIAPSRSSIDGALLASSTRGPNTTRASHEPCRGAVSANECPEPQTPVRIRLARRPLE